MPLDLGNVAGMRTKFQLYTVPGQVYYNSTRKLVLQGVDEAGNILHAEATCEISRDRDGEPVWTPDGKKETFTATAIAKSIKLQPQ